MMTKDERKTEKHERWQKTRKMERERHESRRRTGVWWRRAFCYAMSITSKTSSAMLFVPQVICGTWTAYLMLGVASVLKVPWCDDWVVLKHVVLHGLRCCATFLKRWRVSGLYIYTAWCPECHWQVELAYFWMTLRWVDAFVVGVVRHAFAGRLVSITRGQCWCKVFYLLFFLLLSCLQCFDTVGWAAGRASGL